ncbi:MAG: alcohol dehydrogenase catalytic domain-containing protein, partial [Pseudomonadota bacterium]
MKVAAVKKPGGPGNLVIEERRDPVAGPGEVLVRIKASSLNYHDFVVVMGGIPTDDGRIPMSDGAGEVVAIGDGVSKFKPGDHVLSLFFPDWLKGDIDALGFGGVPGDGADGFAAELVA